MNTDTNHVPRGSELEARLDAAMAKSAEVADELARVYRRESPIAQWAAKRAMQKASKRQNRR